MTIEKVLTISTAHISTETDERLCNGDMNEAGLAVYEKGDCGFWIHIDPVIEVFWYKDEIPEDLMRCIKLAQKNGCSWLCLDCDGDKVPDMPTYEW